MTNTLDSTPPPPAGAPPAPPQQPGQPASPRPSAPRRRTTRTRHAGHIVAIVVGCLLLIPGLGIAAGGAATAIGQAVATDDDGYFRFTLDRVESTGVAIATSDLWIDDVEGEASPWVFDFLDVDLRLRVDGAGPTDDVFVGIARSSDVALYLDDAAYSEVIEINDRAPRYEQIDGDESIESPLDQDFWAVSATGSGEQQLDWDARGGRWSVVVMNADGSPVVAADVEIGARSGVVTPVAVGLLVTGGLLVVIAGALILIGARGRRSSDAETGDLGPPTTPPPPQNPVSPQTPVSPADPDAAEPRSPSVG